MAAFRLVAPAGAPLPLRAILGAALRASGGPGQLMEKLRARLEVRHCFLVSSGRVAVTVFLKALQRVSGRREVVVPAYTCFSVPAAVARAGLVIRLCDIDPKTLDLDQRSLLQLDPSKVLCIIATGLYGVPGNLAALEAIARVWGVFLLDDAAQCLGARVGGRSCGRFGDGGIFSLGRGKVLATVGGGIMVTDNDELGGLLHEGVSRLPRPPAGAASAAIMASLVYAGMIHPRRYWLPARLPFLGLGTSRFDPHFRMTRLSAYQARLAEQQLPSLESHNRIRRKHAEQLRTAINGVEGIEVPRPAVGADPVYIRFPILTRDRNHRSHLSRRLHKSGIGASTSYPSSIEEIAGIKRYLADDQAACPAARSLASRILTLPTHSHVTSTDIEQIASIVR